MTNKEAANELSNCITGTEPKRIQPMNSTPMKSLMERHNVYYDMLQMLPLNNTHFNDLIKRGLSMKNIQNFLYKSVPANEYERRKLLKNCLHNMTLAEYRVFIVKYGEWKIYEPPYGGYFVPVCNKDGIYRVCKSDLTLTMTDIDGFLLMSIRRGQASPLGYTVGDISSDTAYLTEGALKADVTSVLSGGSLLIAIAGVNAVNCLSDTLNQLNVKKVYEMFDMDKQVNHRVKRGSYKNKGNFKRVRDRNQKPVLGTRGIRELMIIVCTKKEAS